MLIDPALLLRQIYFSVVDFCLLTLDLNGNVTSWSVGAESIFGYAKEEAIGKDSASLFTPEDRADGQPFKEMQTAAEHRRAADFRWHLRKDGSRFWADGVMTSVRDDEGRLVGFLKILRDVTDTKLAQDRIRYLASFDSLTGVANRPSFDSRLAEMLALAERGGYMLLLLMIDLDRFKEVNDQLGHAAGDELLHEAASRIANVSRESDMIARLGGDEFALLQLNPPSPDAGGVLATKLLDTLADPFLLDGREAKISASIGLAVYPSDAITAQDLRSKADLALYQAKNMGRNRFHYFTDEMDALVHQRNIDQRELRRVEASKTYWLEYQPIIDCTTGKTIAMEALLRFPEPTLSTYSVDYVVNMAREIGLIALIGVGVFREVCRQFCEWRKLNVSPPLMAVNTCAKELMEPGYISTMEAILTEFDLNPSDIEIELTERDAIELFRNSSSVVVQLQAKGFIVVLDDFGTGYSSLSYLRSLPIAAIKLDKSFLRGIPVEHDANEIVKAVISLAHALRLKITAEGVETREQADFLQGCHCTTFQGHLFSKALSAQAATQWLRGALRYA